MKQHIIELSILSGKSSEQSQTGKEVKPMLFAPKEKGQGLVEYALILVLVAVVVIAVILILKDTLGPLIGNWINNLTSTPTP
jgi:pilus assembly protein Flp/PilA